MLHRHRNDNACGSRVAYVGRIGRKILRIFFLSSLRAARIFLSRTFASFKANSGARQERYRCPWGSSLKRAQPRTSQTSWSELLVTSGPFRRTCAPTQPEKLNNRVTIRVQAGMQNRMGHQRVGLLGRVRRWCWPCLSVTTCVLCRPASCLARGLARTRLQSCTEWLMGPFDSRLLS